MRIGTPRAITPFVRNLRVSAFQPSAGKLQSLECPAGLEALGMAARSFAQNFCNLHEEITQRGGADEVVYYACRFACPEVMNLALKLGYDGPVKAWIDGKLVMHDPNGVNPATPDKSSSRLAAAAGQHEIVVALGTNSGKAWGIFLSLERLGLSKALMLKGPEHYAMPEILG